MLFWSRSMTPTTFFQGAGDILQFAIPTVIGLQDVVPDMHNKAYRDGAIKAMKICTLILIQRYGCMLIKNIVKKRRPDGSDLQSFPSGHFMIGAQCLARSAYRDGPLSTTAILTLLGTVSLGLGRYLPKKHDAVDLAVGGVLGISLGAVWNKWV